MSKEQDNHLVTDIEEDEEIIIIEKEDEKDKTFPRTSPNKPYKLETVVDEQDKSKLIKIIKVALEYQELEDPIEVLLSDLNYLGGLVEVYICAEGVNIEKYTKDGKEKEIQRFSLCYKDLKARFEQAVLRLKIYDYSVFKLQEELCKYSFDITYKDKIYAMKL
jgi:hypothetical protein